MSLRYHEVAEAGHRILNPFTHEKLMMLGEVSRLRPGMRQLDLACGRGEMLCQWAVHHGITGVGVDISDVFLPSAVARAAELGVSDRLEFVRGDAGGYRAEPGAFDVVSCIGATWIGDGLAGTLALMRPALREGGLVLVGEPYATEPAPAAAYEAVGVGPDQFVSLVDTLDRIESAGFELVEMVLADHDSWDRYEAPHWFAMSDWLAANPDDPDAAEFRRRNAQGRRAYLEYGRRYLGWGVFVLRAAGPEK